MMKILSVNAGSSSLKFQLYEMPEEQVLISGVFERIGIDNSFYTIKLNGEKIKKEADLPDHKKAFEILVNELIDNKVIASCDEVKAIGHRTVQGGEKYDHTVVIDEDVINDMIKYSPLAPLHNPAAITGIKAAQEVFKGALQTAVFDTAFHATMDEVNYMYPVPYEWYTKYGVRKYGMHGTSHRFVSMRINQILGREDTKVITCHIGNGASISAVVNGKCIDTSMGLTPNAGVMMGSRCGDIDCSIVPYIMEQTGMTTKEIDNELNKKSGLLGISGVSSDSRDIEDGIKTGNEKCILAQDMYVRRIINYIAMYYVEMGGADAIVFTAGVGENSISTRKQIVDGLAALGIKLDDEANNCRGKENLISSEDSSVKCYVIPTDEELMIARDTYELTK
ncbi:MAG: acetate kinase [Bacilli bacterium]|nr:acetate kinase [Bacilli bacterium]